MLESADAVAREAARLIAAEAHAVVAARGRFFLAVSGGNTPWQMLRVLAGEDVPWKGSTWCRSTNVSPRLVMPTVT